MQNSYRFLIPSYHRCDKQKTVAYLLSIGCDNNRIIVSTQTQEDYNSYRKRLNGVAKVIYRNGASASANRNTLLDYCECGEKVILLEDDINSVVALDVENGKKKRRKVSKIEELDSIIDYGFQIAENNRTICFGLNIAYNAIYMRPGYSHKRLAHTGFMGLINTELRFDENMKLLDDPDMNCQIIRKYGRVMTLNDYAVDIDRFVKGGCYEAWRDKKSVQESYEYLMKKNGDLLKFNYKGHLIIRPEIANYL